MFRLALLLHVFIGATLSGAAIVIVLLAGFASALAMLLAASFGFVAAFPVSLALARRLYA